MERNRLLSITILYTYTKKSILRIKLVIFQLSAVWEKVGVALLQAFISYLSKYITKLTLKEVAGKWMFFYIQVLVHSVKFDIFNICTYYWVARQIQFECNCTHVVRKTPFSMQCLQCPQTNNSEAFSDQQHQHKLDLKYNSF